MQQLQKGNKVKITKDNIDLLDDVCIEIPDEIEWNGVFYEMASIKSAKEGEMYLDSDQGLSVADYNHNKDDWHVILRPIQRPTAEWLDEHNKTAIEKPEVVKSGDIVFISNGAKSIFICNGGGYTDLIGKCRFILKEKVREIKKAWVRKGTIQLCQYCVCPLSTPEIGCMLPKNMTCDKVCYQPIPEPAKEVHMSCEGCDNEGALRSADQLAKCFLCKTERFPYYNRNWTPKEQPKPTNLCEDCTGERCKVGSLIRKISKVTGCENDFTPNKRQTCGKGI